VGLRAVASVPGLSSFKAFPLISFFCFSGRILSYKSAPLIKSVLTNALLYKAALLVLLVFVTESWAEIPLSPEEILSKRGQGSTDMVFSALIDQNREIEMYPSLVLQVWESRRYASIIGFSYGITSRVEVTGAVAGDISKTRVDTESNSVSSRYSEDFREVSLGVNWLVLREVDYPALLLTAGGVVLERDTLAFQGKSFHDLAWFRGFDIGASIYKQIDPVVLLANLEYQANFKRKVKETSFRPGRSMSGNIVAIFGANERLSISGGIAVGSESPDNINGASVGRKQTAVSLLNGVSLALTPIWSMVVSSQMGLTEASPDAAISFKVVRYLV
jgi:hypothetical protein